MLGKDRSLRRHGAEWERWAARAPFLLPWRSAAEGVKEAVRAGEVAALEGYGSEDAEQTENKNEEKEEGEKAESESTPVSTIAAANNNSSKAKKRGGGRASSARNKGIAAGGR